MERLCERPGCSDPASVAYGMRAEDLVFWLDVLRDRNSTEHGVLCRRHADSMVVPRNWTLDDLRDPELHLFRPPSDDSGPISRPRRRRPPSAIDHEQLELGVEPAVPADGALSEPLPVPHPAAVPAAEPGESEDVAAGGSSDAPTVPGDAGAGVDVDADVDAGADQAPWMPVFDTEDDLDGLLAARSPLLSRAFRGERPA